MAGLAYEQTRWRAEMRNLVLFMHVSLDGFVAGPNGELDWAKVDEEIFDYAGERTNQSDMALYGRVTYEMMEAYWPTAADQPEATKHDIEHARWYNRVPKVILSRTMPPSTLPGIKIINVNLSAQINALKQLPGKEIIIFGSPGATHSLMAENLIDDYWLFVNPILLGQGTPLFKDMQQRMTLKLVASHAFTCGVVCLHYTRS